MAGNCYGSGPIPLLPDSTIPSLYSFTSNLQGEPAPPVVTNPGDQIRAIVGSCYGPNIGLTPDSYLVGLYTRDTLGEPTPAPTVSPGAVIREIVARCYPTVAPAEVPDVELGDWDQFTRVPLDDFFDWFCEYFPDNPVCGLKPPTLLPPYPWSPLGPSMGEGDDCERIMEGLQANPPTVRKTANPIRTTEYVVIETGEILNCELEWHDRNVGWENCVKEAVECMFKPFTSGTWKTPEADCSTFTFRGQNNRTNEVCVKNCFPDRRAIYEYTNGSDHSYGYEETAPAGYSRTSSEAAFYIYKNYTTGTVPLYRFYSPSTTDTFLTTNPGLPDSQGAGERATMNAAGMQQGTILGYVFSKGDDATPYLSEDEKIGELHRYYKAGDDHMYSLEKFSPDEPPKYDQSKLIYRIPLNPKTGFNIDWKMKKPAAAYQNSWGVYIGDKKGDNIYWNRVLEDNVNVNYSVGSYTIPLGVLAQYPGKYIGFYLVPDGNRNGISVGDSLSFYKSGGGWKRNNTAESNYVFFSNPKMNPGNRSKTRWQGENWQWWEDLLSGDDDYDDFKVWYEVNSGTSAYVYEGLQCYVFANPTPERVYVPVVPQDRCKRGQSGHSKKGTWKDVQVARSKCGPKAGANWQDLAEAVPCGTCEGAYTVEVNRTQSTQMYETGVYQLKAYGKIISDTDTDCMTFRFTLKKNGSSLVDETIEMVDWPDIGTQFGSDFTLQSGDTVTFKIEDIISGPEAAQAVVYFILYNTSTKQFHEPLKITLRSVQDDDQVRGTTEYISDAPFASGGSTIKKVAIQLYDYEGKDWTPKVIVWDNGQTNTNGANGQSATWNSTYNGGGYYEFGGRNGHVLSSRIDEDGPFTNTTPGRGIFYNQLFDHGRGLFCKPANTIGDLLTEFNHHSVGSGFTSWFLNDKTINNPGAMIDINNYYAKGTIGQSGGQYSKMSFIQDYVLGRVENQEEVVQIPPTGKIRLGFWPYTESVDVESDRWGCAIECLEIPNAGGVYREGDYFDLEFPQPQPRRDSYQPQQYADSPFFPWSDPAFSMPTSVTLQRRGDSKPEIYTPRESFYQESQNRDSNIWYLSHYKVKRVKFRVTIEEVS